MNPTPNALTPQTARSPATRTAPLGGGVAGVSVSRSCTPLGSKASERRMAILPVSSQHGCPVAPETDDIGRSAYRETYVSVAATQSHPGGEADAHRSRNNSPIGRAAIPGPSPAGALSGVAFPPPNSLRRLASVGSGVFCGRSTDHGV